MFRKALKNVNEPLTERGHELCNQLISLTRVGEKGGKAYKEVQMGNVRENYIQPLLFM